MAAGRRVPAPYAHRPLAPMLGRWLGLATVGSVATAATVPLVYGLTLILGGLPWTALAAAAVWIGTDSGFGFLASAPWLADGLAYALVLLACVLPAPYSWAAWILAGAAKDGISIVGGAFAVLMWPSQWLGPALGLTAATACRLLPAAPPDERWLAEPVTEAHRAKLDQWWDYRRNLAALKLTPYLAGWALPGTEMAWPVGGAVGLAWLQCHAAQDHGRLIAAAAPFAIASSAAVVDPRLLAPWALLTLFWPWPVPLKDVL